MIRQTGMQADRPSDEQTKEHTDKKTDRFTQSPKKIRIYN